MKHIEDCLAALGVCLLTSGSQLARYAILIMLICKWARLLIFIGSGMKVDLIA